MTDLTTKYAHNGDTVGVFTHPEGSIKDKVEPAIYTIEESMFGFYLKRKAYQYKTPNPLFGTSEQKAQRVLNMFNHRETGVGVMLTGTKGAGKSMTSEVICNKFISEGYPVIEVQNTHKDSPIPFIQSLGDCVLYFDEFAKNYVSNNDEDSQNDWLPLFGGVSDGHKRTIIITENDKYELNEFMRDRPTRFHYNFDYQTLEDKVIDDYCKYHNVEETAISAIKIVKDVVFTFTFDTLKALVLEWQVRDKTIPLLDLAKDMNIGFSDNITVKLNIKDIKGDDYMVDIQPVDKIIKLHLKEGTLVKFNYKNSNNMESDSYTVRIDSDDIVEFTEDSITFMHNMIKIVTDHPKEMNHILYGSF